MKSSLDIALINKDRNIKETYKLQPIKDLNILKKLRKNSIASYYMCRIALQQTDWNYDEAYKWLLYNCMICKG